MAAPDGSDELASMMSELKLKKKSKKKEKAADEAGAAGGEAESAAADGTGAGSGSGAGAGADASGAAPHPSSSAATPSSLSAFRVVVDDKGTYNLLMLRVYDQLRANNPDLVNKRKAVMPPPQVMRVGTSRILWTNFADTCKRMKRDPDHVMRFFLTELGTTGSIDGSDRFLMKGKFVPKYIESLLKRYINEYVTCSMCRNVDTRLSRDALTRMYFMHCESCGASRAVQAIQKGYHATAKGERRAARNAVG